MYGISRVPPFPLWDDRTQGTVRDTWDNMERMGHLSNTNYTGAYTFKVHSTTMQPQGSRVGLNIVPFNIHIMKRLEDTTPAAEVDAKC